MQILLTILFVWLTTSTTDFPTYVSSWKKRWIKKIPFLEVLIDNSQPQSPITRVYRKKSFTTLLTKYFSFTPFFYNLGLIRTLVYRTYTINKLYMGRPLWGYQEVIVINLTKKPFPQSYCWIVEKVIRQYINKTQTPSNIPASPPSNSTHFLKLPYVGPFSRVTQNRLHKLLKCCCNNLDVKLTFSSFQICNMFGVKDPVPIELCSNVVYKFTCASCNSCNVDKTSRHL